MSTSYKTPMESISISGLERQSAGAGLLWSTIFGGLFISLLTYWVLISFGIGIGSFGLQVDEVTGGTLQALSLGAATWIVIACAISLGVGAYTCVRVANTVQSKYGMVQSFVMSSLFFAVMATQATSILVPIASRSIGALGSATMALSEQPRVQTFFEDSIGSLELRGLERDALIKAIGIRLVTGDQISLRGLLAQHSNMTSAEISTRVSQLQASFERLKVEIANGVGKAMAFSGWVLFSALLLGSIGGALGAAYATRNNHKRPGFNWVGRGVKARENYAAL